MEMLNLQSHPLASEGLSTYAKEFVRPFFRRYKNTDPTPAQAHVRQVPQISRRFKG
jgi:hypothetical protein